MDKKEMLNYTGTLQQLAYTRNITVQEGRANDMRAVEVKNGDMRYMVLADKALDIGEFDYKGMTLSFTAKPGLMGCTQFDTSKKEAIRSIMGGLFFTCGLQNIGATCESDGVEYPMHGRIRTTPAEHLCSDAYWDGDDYILEVKGEMRESHLFGTNLVLRRTVRSVYGSNKIEIFDEVENQSGEAADLMFMYHCNFGYPFLQPGTRLVLPSVEVKGREQWAQDHVDCWQTASEPKQGEAEYVFIHTFAADEKDRTFAAIVNDKLGFGVRLDYDRKMQPYFMEWMSMKTGDYVIGLEPSNSSIYGRNYHEKEGTMHRIAPFATEKYYLSFTILEDAAAIAQTEADQKRLLNL